jgi:hypothetical protein
MKSSRVHINISNEIYYKYRQYEQILLQNNHNRTKTVLLSKYKVSFVYIQWNLSNLTHQGNVSDCTGFILVNRNTLGP